MKSAIPFGCWPSKLSAELVAGKSVRFSRVQADGGCIYWTETRPEEQGRAVVSRHCPGAGTQVLLPDGFSAHSKVHEYGGGEFLSALGTLYFTNDRDQDIYALDQGQRPRRLTEDRNTRFADFALDTRNNRLIVVAERHGTSSRRRQPENFLAAVACQNQPVATILPLTNGHGFYAHPRISPDGRYLAFVAWDLPHMPWEAAILYCAILDDNGKLADIRQVAGGPREAVFQPDWLHDGQLVFVSEKSGWNLPYRWSPADGKPPTRLLGKMADFGQPLWVLHMRSWAQLDADHLAVRYIEEGVVRLGRLALADGKLTEIATPFSDVTDINADDGRIVCLGTEPGRGTSLVRITPDNGEISKIRPAADPPLSSAEISRGHIVEIPPHDRPGGPASPRLFGIYYQPTSATCEAEPDTLPPVILRVHGGPSAMADRGFHLKVQYWTSRGFGIFDVDYAGSTGYGRAYRERLDGYWGVRDVADIVRAGEHLTAAGLADNVSRRARPAKPSRTHCRR